MEKAPNALSLGAFFMKQNIHNNQVVVIINNHIDSQCSENKSDRENPILLLVGLVLENIIPITKTILFIVSILG